MKSLLVFVAIIEIILVVCYESNEWQRKEISLPSERFTLREQQVKLDSMIMSRPLSKCICRCCSLAPSLYVVCSEETVVTLSANHTCRQRRNVHIVSDSTGMGCTAAHCLARLKHRCQRPGYVVHKCLDSKLSSNNTTSKFFSGVFSIWGRLTFMSIGLVLSITVAAIKLRSFEREKRALDIESLPPPIELVQCAKDTNDEGSSSENWWRRKWGMSRMTNVFGQYSAVGTNENMFLMGTQCERSTILDTQTVVKGSFDCANDKSHETIENKNDVGRIPLIGEQEAKFPRARNKVVTFGDDNNRVEDKSVGTNCTLFHEVPTHTDTRTYLTFAKNVVAIDIGRKNDELEK